MRKITFIVFVALHICLIVLSIIMFFIKYTSVVKFAIVGLSACYIYFLGWLLGYDAGLIDKKDKKQGDGHSLDALEYAKKVCDNEERVKHDEIAQIVEAQRIYANSKDKKVCKKCVNCKHFANDSVCLYNGFLAVGSKEIAYRFNNCKHFEAKDL